jgi:hypothetical protein
LLLIFYFRQIADIAKTTDHHQIDRGIGEGYNDDVLKTIFHRCSNLLLVLLPVGAAFAALHVNSEVFFYRIHAAEVLPRYNNINIITATTIHK